MTFIAQLLHFWGICELCDNLIEHIVRPIANIPKPERTCSSVFVLHSTFLNRAEFRTKLSKCSSKFEKRRHSLYEWQEHEEVQNTLAFRFQKRQIAQLSAFVGSKRLSFTPLSTTAKNGFMLFFDLKPNYIHSQNLPVPFSEFTSHAEYKRHNGWYIIYYNIMMPHPFNQDLVFLGKHYFI